MSVLKIAGVLDQYDAHGFLHMHSLVIDYFAETTKIPSPEMIKILEETPGINGDNCNNHIFRYPKYNFLWIFTLRDLNYDLPKTFQDLLEYLQGNNFRSIERQWLLLPKGERTFPLKEKEYIRNKENLFRYLATCGNREINLTKNEEKYKQFRDYLSENLNKAITNCFTMYYMNNDVTPGERDAMLYFLLNKEALDLLHSKIFSADIYMEDLRDFYNLAQEYNFEWAQAMHSWRGDVAISADI